MDSNHPSDHNTISDALTDIINELGSTPRGSAASLSARVADIEANDWVTSARIASGAVAAAELATDAVETVKIKDANVTVAKLAADAVETAKIKDANVTAAKLATDAVETAKIKDGAVTNGKVANATLTGSKIADEAFLTYAPIVSGINTNGGPVSGRYHKMGNLVFFHIDLELGAPGWTITAPIVLATPTNAVANWQHLYNAQIVDVPGTWYPAETRYQTVGSFALGAVRVFGQPFIDFNISATVPFSFATGDRFFVSGWYEEA